MRVARHAQALRQTCARATRKAASSFTSAPASAATKLARRCEQRIQLNLNRCVLCVAFFLSHSLAAVPLQTTRHTHKHPHNAYTPSRVPASKFSDPLLSSAKRTTHPPTANKESIVRFRFASQLISCVDRLARPPTFLGTYVITSVPETLRNLNGTTQMGRPNGSMQFLVELVLIQREGERALKIHNKFHKATSSRPRIQRT